MDAPAHGCEGCDGRGDQLGGKEVAESCWGNEEEWKLYYPEEEIARGVSWKIESLMDV